VFVHYHPKPFRMFREALFAMTAASAFVGCAGGPHALPATPVAGGGSELTQPLSSLVSPESGITEYSIPTVGAQAADITVGPDGNPWFTEANSNKIAKITAAGKIAEYLNPTAGSPNLIVRLAGRLWFTEHTAGSPDVVETPTDIDTIARGGKFGTSIVPLESSYEITGLAVGSDGNLWYTDPVGSSVGRVTPAGSSTEFLYAPIGPVTIANIVAGPAGNLWFTDEDDDVIATITTSGTITKYSVPTADAGPRYIAAGPDGDLWFTEFVGNKIGRITAEGKFTEYPIPTPDAQADDITAGRDGNLWFTEYKGNKIGRITAAGKVTEYLIPTAGAQPAQIAASRDGNLWFIEAGINKIGRINAERP